VSDRTSLVPGGVGAADRISHPSRPSHPGTPTGAEPRSMRFRREREAEWAELETILERALPRGLRALHPSELARLPLLYRSAVSSLSVARKTAMDRALVRYLESLASRAYLAVYTSRTSERGALLRFFALGFPRAVRSMLPELALSVALFVLGIVVAYGLVRWDDAEWYFAFVDPGLSGGRSPGATTEYLRSVLYDSQGQEGMLSIFASFLFDHNARIGLIAFALGFAAGVPTALLVFQNGLMLGAFLALYDEHGLLIPLLGWLLPHGVPELSAIILCGAGGLAMGKAMLAPGERTVRSALTDAGKRGAIVASGAVALFFVAGLVEGIFRQVVTNDVLRFAMATFNASWLLAWLVIGGSYVPGLFARLAPRRGAAR
jgi:uncharacterized membrane protein SpoIIM required for sporulation